MNFNSLQGPFALAARIAMALLFVPAGFSKITGFSGTAKYVGSVFGSGLAEVGVVVAIIVELGVGLALLVGYKTRLSAVILAAFTLVAAFFFHGFWNMMDPMGIQKVMFFKNVAIAGGLLSIAAFGGGYFSLDKGK